MNKALNKDIDESWINWALEMMEAGFQSESLYILASMRWPFNQFELQELTNKVIQDLHLDYGDKSTVIRNYVYFIIARTIDNPENYLLTLRELKDICNDLDMDKEYMDFYLLYFAKHELSLSERQSYWIGATRENIDEVINNHFIKWTTEYRRRKTPA